jgi:iron-sulfur cluster assembly protein
MVEVSVQAAQQIIKSAHESKMQGMPLRVAATKNTDGSIHYGMGFDDIGNRQGSDQTFTSNGIEIVVAESSLDLVKGMTIDYVEIEPKQFRFVFLNPNDPNYNPPEPTA